MKRSARCLIVAMLWVVGSCSAAAASEVWLTGVTATSGWSDVNKSYDGDSQMCWAASSSNVLAYTNWNGTSSVSTSTTASSIFSDFTSNWTNDYGNHPYVGIYWWFTGENKSAGVDGWSQLTSSTQTAHYNDILFYDNIDYINFTRIANLSTSIFETIILEYLTAGYGMALDVGWSSTSGHSVTVWGIDAISDLLYITDSDDGQTKIEKVHYYLSGNYIDLAFTYYGSSSIGVLEDLVALASTTPSSSLSAVPIPGAVWLFGSGLLALIGVRKRNLSESQR